MMRIKLVVGSVVAMLVAFAMPAAADPPVDDSFTVTFEASNPCIDGIDVFTSTFHISDHLGHPNNYVSPSHITGTTASGFVLEHGRDIIVENRGNSIYTFSEVFVHPDGSRFVAHSVTVVDRRTGEARVDLYAERCVVDRG